MPVQDASTIFRNLCNAIELEEELLEILLPYLDTLLAIGVDFSYVPLQEAIEGNFCHLETACQALLGYAGALVMRNNRFGSKIHATACLNKALIECWQPYPQWRDFVAIAPMARYLTPYEEAYRLLLEIEEQGYVPPYSRHALESISDHQIQAMIPTLRQYKAAIFGR